MWGTPYEEPKIDKPVATWRLVKAVREYLATPTTGNQERLTRALRIYDETDR